MSPTSLLNGKPHHITLADDDFDDCDIFVEAWHEIAPQIKVSVESNGANLMETLLNAPDNSIPDILFIDLNMPRKNGVECLIEIRNLEKLKSIPVIVYSTSSNPDLINITYDKGANFYIQKPQSFKEIKKILQKVLALKQHDYFPQPPISKFVLTTI